MAQPPSPVGLEPVAVRYGRYRTDAGFQIVRSLLDEGIRFDGLFGADDLIALGAIQALHRAGRRVPNDVAVCGFDGMPGSELWTPTLTTVAQRIHEMGAAAARILVDRIEGRLETIPRVLLPVELVVRASTDRSEDSVSRDASRRAAPASPKRTPATAGPTARATPPAECCSPSIWPRRGSGDARETSDDKVGATSP